MKTKLIVVGLILSLISVVSADTFRNKETGEVFNGFRTQKRTADKVLVYHSEQKKLITIEEGQYEITLDGKGRRDSVIRVPIRQAEVLVSKTVADRVAMAIKEASNSGPQFIVVEIDSPGGSGENMKIIASAITQTTNCPVVAYIPGGDYSGAYSSAAVIAMACEEIYMAPTASLGAVGPMTGASATNEQYADFLSLYSPDTLASYSSYAMGLVRKSELGLVARAMVDKSVSVVEVLDTDGKTKFVERSNRQPTQTIVGTLAEGVSRTPAPAAAAGDQAAPAESPLPAEIIGRVLTLNSAEALRIGLADKIVSSIDEIVSARGLEKAQVVNAPDIDATIKKFVAGRRSIGQSLAIIERLEDNAYTLEDQIARVEDQMRTGTVTRETGQLSAPRGASRRGQINYNYSGFDNTANGTLRDGYGQRGSTTDRRRRVARDERVTTELPNVSVEVLRTEQAGVLRNLVAEYRKVIGLAERWPGGLPPEITVQTLEKNRDSAAMLLDYIIRYPTQTYQNTQPVQQQPLQQQNTGRRTSRQYR